MMDYKNNFVFKISVAAIAVATVYVPYDAQAGTITCSSGSFTQETLNCDGISTNLSYNAHDTVECGCGEGYNGAITYRCVEQEAGGYEGTDRMEGYWVQDKNSCLKYECVAGQTQTCTTTSIASGTQECTSANVWGVCKATSCKSGYVLVNQRCHPECEVVNGMGYIFQSDASSGGDSGSDSGDEETSSSSSSTAV